MSIWNFLLTKRALAFAALHYKNELPQVRRGQLDPILYVLTNRLVELRTQKKTSTQGPLVPPPNDPYHVTPRMT
jgi:hypothetical protein